MFASIHSTSRTFDLKTLNQSNLRRIVFVSFSIVLGSLLSVCGDNLTAPTTTATSTSNTPTITLVGLNPSRVETMLQIGQTQAYQLSNSPSTTGVIWTSTDPTILSIDESGTATGLANGHVTLSAKSDTGQTAMLTVQVVPVYQGPWTGAVTITSCTALAGFVSNNYCSQVLGATQPFTMTLNQVNSNTGNSQLRCALQRFDSRRAENQPAVLEGFHHVRGPRSSVCEISATAAVARPTS
jgi:Big-like domain-containing protein